MGTKPKFLSENGLAYYWSQIKNLLAGKVDAETGKGLSTNDYSSVEKEKLAGIESLAQKNLIESIKVNGTTQGITSKAVDISVPTRTSDITNDSDYQTSTQVSAAITTALSSITGFEFEKVNALPATGTKGVIYLLAHSHGADDGFDEYIWIDTGFEKLGHTDIDLSGYVEITDVISNADIDNIMQS